MKEERIRALGTAIAQIEKEFGKGSIMRLGEEGAKVQVDVISTGSIGIDAALGIGGFPRGRIAEIFGPEASGKTTLALQVIAEAQKMGGTAAFIDAEHALDPIYAKALGVNLEDLLISQPDTGEQALEIAEVLTRSGGLDVFVIDSVAALVPRAEIEGEMGEAFIGLQARLMSQALRKLAGVISKSKTCAIFVNQIRHKIGVFYGSPETTPGGLALKFHSTLRIDIRRIASIKKGEEVIGNRTRVRIVKNKMAPPFRETELDIIYGHGISKTNEIVDLAAEKNIIQKSGTWYAYGDLRIGQGRDGAVEFLSANPEVLTKVEKELRKALNLSVRSNEDNEAKPSKTKGK
jgi:recombination protein RecA